MEKKSISFPTVRGTSIDTELDTTSWSHQLTLPRGQAREVKLTSPTAIPSCLPSGRASWTNFLTLLPLVSCLLLERAKTAFIRSIIDLGAVATAWISLELVDDGIGDFVEDELNRT